MYYSLQSVKPPTPPRCQKLWKWGFKDGLRLADRGTVDDCDDFCGNIGGGANTRPCGDENKGVFILAACFIPALPAYRTLEDKKGLYRCILYFTSLIQVLQTLFTGRFCCCTIHNS